MNETRRGSGRTSAALRQAMQLAQNGPVYFVAFTAEAAQQLVDSAKRVGNDLVQLNLRPIGSTASAVNVARGTVTGCRVAVFDHYVIERHQEYLRLQIQRLTEELKSLSGKGYCL